MTPSLTPDPTEILTFDWMVNRGVWTVKIPLLLFPTGRLVD